MQRVRTHSRPSALNRECCAGMGGGLGPYRQCRRPAYPCPAPRVPTPSCCTRSTRRTSTERMPISHSRNQKKPPVRIARQETKQQQPAPVHGSAFDHRRRAQRAGCAWLVPACIGRSNGYCASLCLELVRAQPESLKCRVPVEIVSVDHARRPRSTGGSPIVGEENVRAREEGVQGLHARLTLQV